VVDEDDEASVTAGLGAARRCALPLY